MRTGQQDIIDDIEAHIRKFGGDYSEWCGGTAKDSEAPFFRRHSEQNLGDQMIYREAYTPYAADDVRDRLVSGCGLHADRASGPPSPAESCSSTARLKSLAWQRPEFPRPTPTPDHVVILRRATRLVHRSCFLLTEKR
jgi:hypothetical protein